MKASEQIISPFSEECSIKQNIRPVGDIKQSFGLKQHRSSSNCCPLGCDCYLNFSGAKSVLGKLLNGMFTEAMNNNELISSKVIFLENIENLVCSLLKEMEVLPGSRDAVFGQIRQETCGGYIMVSNNPD